MICYVKYIRRYQNISKFRSFLLYLSYFQTY